MRRILILALLSGSTPAFAQQDYSATITDTLEEPAFIPDRSFRAAAATRERPNISGFVFYRVCADARLAGRAPLYRGEAGYRPELDRDGDGVACEPYRQGRAQ